MLPRGPLTSGGAARRSPALKKKGRAIASADGKSSRSGAILPAGPCCRPGRWPPPLKLVDVELYIVVVALWPLFALQRAARNPAAELCLRFHR